MLVYPYCIQFLVNFDKNHDETYRLPLQPKISSDRHQYSTVLDFDTTTCQFRFILHL